MKNLERSDFYRRLDSEIGAWQQEGLILPEQATALRQRYETLARGQVMAHRLGPVATLLSIVGSVVVAAGVLLFVTTQ
ncbi:MAG TPA: DUF2157 domain-containing protein [Chloroflexota bacterium]|nr:DUF2157 domain-containing protein [Chloroflexota bacterium]